MKTRYRNIIIPVLCSLCVCSCDGKLSTKEYSKDFELLDAAIEAFDEVVADEMGEIAYRTAELSSTTDRERMKSACMYLTDAYEKLSVDSLAKYTSMYLEMAETPDEKAQGVLRMSSIAQMKEDFTSSEKLILSIDTTLLSKEVYMEYLKHLESVNYSMFVRAFNAENCNYLNHSDKYYREVLRGLREEYLLVDSTSLKAVLFKVSELRDDKRYPEAMEYLLANEAGFTTLSQKVQYNRYKAVLYEFLGDEKMRLHALIASEYYAFQLPTYDHLSLISISRRLLTMGDLERSSKYISLAEEYALKHKQVARMANAGKASRKILAAVNKERKQNQYKLYAAIGFLSLVSLLLVLLLYYSIVMRRRLALAHSLLKESDMIKDNYLFKYMAQSVEYLQKAEQYHKELRKLSKTDKEMLFAKLRMPSEFETDRKEFYRVYDRNFILLFPNFLNNINALMKEDCRYELNSNGTMPVELRVLSVIKLGMTDSQQISTFLNYSLSTVYTYRSRAAEKSIYSRDEFEEELLKMPLQ